MIIAVDFDGTIVKHAYPEIGEEIPFALHVLKVLQALGHKLILYTMRSGETLKEAVKYCKGKGIKFWAVNENPEQKEWTNSPKVYAHFYIDDAAVGVPLKSPEHERPFVDWYRIAAIFDIGLFSI